MKVCHPIQSPTHSPYPLALPEGVAYGLRSSPPPVPSLAGGKNPQPRPRPQRGPRVGVAQGFAPCLLNVHRDGAKSAHKERSQPLTRIVEAYGLPCGSAPPSSVWWCRACLPILRPLRAVSVARARALICWVAESCPCVSRSSVGAP